MAAHSQLPSFPTTKLMPGLKRTSLLYVTGYLHLLDKHNVPIIGGDINIQIDKQKIIHLPGRRSLDYLTCNLSGWVIKSQQNQSCAHIVNFRSKQMAPVFTPK